MSKSSKYSAAHVSPQGPGDARPTGLQVVKNEELIGKLTGKTFLITGCSSGIGVETARAISATGARLYLPVRDLANSQRSLAEVLEPGRVELLQMDLTSLASVRHCGEEFIERHFGRDGLHANAVMPGGIWTPLQKHWDQESLAKRKANVEVNKIIKSTEQGAATTVWAAVAKEWEGKGGRYLENCQQTELAVDPKPLDPGFAKHAFDEEAEERLWVESEKLVGL